MPPITRPRLAWALPPGPMGALPGAILFLVAAVMSSITLGAAKLERRQDRIRGRVLSGGRIRQVHDPSRHFSGSCLAS